MSPPRRDHIPRWAYGMPHRSHRSRVPSSAKKANSKFSFPAAPARNMSIKGSFFTSASLEEVLAQRMGRGEQERFTLAHRKSPAVLPHPGFHWRPLYET